jgi:hypothetical protein
MRVHLAREHAPELEDLELLRDAFDELDDVREGVGILLLARELVQLASFVERLPDLVQRRNDGLELGPLAS